MGKWIHKLTNINTQTRMGDCANCGLVKVKPVPPDRYICRVRLNNERRRYRYKRYSAVGNLPPLTDDCMICHIKMKRRNLDHCHTTGRLRGWLCFRCNAMLGLVKDDIKVLRSAIKYLS